MPLITATVLLLGDVLREVLFVGAILVAAFAFTIVQSVIGVVRHLDRIRLSPLDPAGVFEQGWDEPEGFAPLGTYETDSKPPITLVMFQHGGRPTFLCFYLTEKSVFADFVTCYPDESILTTSNTKSMIQMPAPPSGYRQSFPARDVAGLWQEHLSGEAALQRELGLRPTGACPPFERTFCDALRRQSAHIRSLPLWPLRTFAWILITPRRMRNVPLAVQFERGMIRAADRA